MNVLYFENIEEVMIQEERRAAAGRSRHKNMG